MLDGSRAHALFVFFRLTFRSLRHSRGLSPVSCCARGNSGELEGKSMQFTFERRRGPIGGTGGRRYRRDGGNASAGRQWRKQSGPRRAEQRPAFRKTRETGSPAESRRFTHGRLPRASRAQFSAARIVRRASAGVSRFSLAPRSRDSRIDIERTLFVVFPSPSRRQSVARPTRRRFA